MRRVPREHREDPANVTSITKKSTAKQQPVEPAEPATDQAIEQPKPKSKLSWKERLALMTPEEAAAARAKANEASKISKAKKRGTTPVVAETMRLNAKLAKNKEKTQLLAEERAQIERALADLEAKAKEEQAPVETEAGSESA